VDVTCVIDDLLDSAVGVAVCSPAQLWLARTADLACCVAVVEWPNARPAAVGRSAVLVDGRRLRGLRAVLIGRCSRSNAYATSAPVPRAIDLELGTAGTEGQYDLWVIG